MSADMARQGGRVQLEQSDMRLTLNMAKIVKQGFSRAAMEDTQQLIKKPHAQVRGEKKQRVVFPGHIKVNAAIERHPAMFCDHQMDSCLTCEYCTAKNPQTRRRCIGTGAPPPRSAPPRPGTPPVPPVDRERTQSSETEGLPPGYLYIHTPLHSARFFNHDPCCKDRMRNKDFIPDFLTEGGPSTG